MKTQAYNRMNENPVTVEVAGESEYVTEQDQDVVYYQVDEEIAIDLSDVSAEKGCGFTFALDLQRLGNIRYP